MTRLEWHHVFATLLFAGSAYMMEDAATACLMWQGDGCESITDETLCVHSRDGMAHNFFGSVRLGKACAWHKRGVCERIDEWVRKREDPGDYKVATCKDGETINTTIAAVQPPASTESHSAPGTRAHMPWGAVKLQPMDGGSNRACRGVTQGQTGFVSRQYNFWTAQTLDDCKALCTGPCTGIEFQASKKYCETWFGDILFSTKSDGFDCYVKENIDQASKLAMIRPQDDSCLREEIKGCGALQDRYSCLSSKDGSDTTDIFGLKVKGEPCIWCGGTACRTGSANKCEPFDFLMRGMGKEHGFDSFTAVGSFETPTCEAGKSTVFDEAAQMVFGNVDCLKKQAEGCGAIKDRSTCLSSVDGRQFPGLKVENQPCVWCGGAPCNADNDNLCEPYGFALNDKSGAFHTYFSAACEAGKPVEESISTAMARQGSVKIVNCGLPNPAWLGVSKNCGFCKVQVADQAAESYLSCNAYCQAQGGLQCAKAFKGFMSSCDVGAEITCDAAFEKNSYPVCECSPAPVKDHTPNILMATHLPRPAEEKLACLDVVAEGCGSLKDQLKCLSSKDGSVADYHGLKIAGEPCVWCGGGSCSDNDENVLCAAYDFLANGQGLAFTSRQAITVMDVAHCKEPRTSFGNVDCLSRVSAGCGSLKDKDACLASVDGSPYKQLAGLKVEGQPCVWCGGGPCSEHGNLCEPHEFVVHGVGHAFNTGTSIYTTAACEAGKPVQHEMPSSMANYGANVAVDCGIPNPIWYKVGKVCGFCKVQVAKMALPVYKNCTGYCKAQGLTCSKAFKGYLHSCDVESSLGCDEAFGTETAPLCQCSPALIKNNFEPVKRPSEEQMQCLKPEEKGCFEISDRINCLSSKDGSTSAAGKGGFKIAGEPCVWCGDGTCTTDSAAKCAPYDWLMNGKGIEYSAYHAEGNYNVATCKANADAVFSNLDCLTSEATGCNSIQDEDKCLKSKDGRPYEYIAGFKAAGQPCVWCGGGNCHTASTNKCEPYDFAVNGEGHAFDTFHAVGTYKMASCEAGAVAVHFLNSGFSEHGTSLQVSCGSGPAPIWSKVSRTCGECTVNVPNIKEFTYTCNTYCKNQPGSPQCISASVAYHPSSCDVKMGASCDYKFSDDQDALCQCDKVLYPHQKVQALYAQCGGKEWKGRTGCEAGAVCNIVDEWYSQCVPALAAQPGIKFTSGEAELAAASAPIGGEEDLGAAAPVLGAAAVAGVAGAAGAAGAAGEVLDAACSAHPQCADLKLSGNCCPNDDAVVLGCCKNFDPAAVKAVPTEPPVIATLAPLDLATPAPPDQSYWRNQTSRPTQAELACLPAEPKGCSAIKHKLMCLSRVDGRTGYTVHGLNVGGEPCVWCGGGPCTDFSSAVCEPYDWLVHGSGKAFGTVHARHSLTVARCHESKNSVFSDEQVSCLSAAEVGCNAIRDKSECLKSRDGRPYSQVAGFKTNNQPCVWCDGLMCHSNNDNMCEPFDFVMNGAGHAFGSNIGALNTYMVPECQDGKLIRKRYGSAAFDRGLPKTVKCGGTESTWNGISKVCANCDVTIPNINATYGTCEKYCASQGGRKCFSAGLAYTHSCEVQAVNYLLACTTSFDEGEAARCRCQSEQVAAAAEEAAAELPLTPYSQCGGEGWTGQTKCQVFNTCAVVNKWYSQCLPGGMANPDQAAEAASQAAQVAGKTLQEQASYAGQAASEAAKVAGLAPATQATRAYVGAAGTADEGGLAHEEANAAGVAAVKDALQDAGVASDQVDGMTDQAVAEGKIIVFGHEQNPRSAPYIAGEAAFNQAHDAGLSKEEKCQKAYAAAWKTAKANGKVGEQITDVAADVMVKLATKIGMSPEEQVKCSMEAAQVVTKASGGFSDDIASSMHHAGVVVAVDAGMPSAQVDSTVSAALEDVETEKGEKIDATRMNEIMSKCLAAGQAAGDKAAESAAIEAANVGKALGMSGVDVSQVARKCAYEAAIASGRSPVEATAAAEATRSMVPSVVTSPANGDGIKPDDLQNIGKDCWLPCGKASGLCAFCGLGNACCRADEPNAPKACQGVVVSTWHHSCVKPVDPTSDADDLSRGVESAMIYAEARAKGDEMADAAKSAGKGVDDQVAAAAEGAMDSMNSEHAKVSDVVSAAYKSAHETGLEEGLSEPAAQTAAIEAIKDELHKSGMSSAEAATISASAATATTAVVVAPTVNIHGGGSGKTGSTAAAVPPVVTKPEETTATVAPETPATLPATLAPATTAEPAEVTEVPTVEPTETVAPLATVAPAATLAPAATIAPADLTTVAPAEVATLPPITQQKVGRAGETASIAKAEGTGTLPSVSEMSDAVQVGVAAADLKKKDGADVDTQALVAAGTSGSYAAADGYATVGADDEATEVAKYIYMRSGKSAEEASALALKTVAQAKADQGGEFVAPGLLQRHGFSDCWEPCGKKAGYCPEYCGTGNACCRKTGDIVVPRECKDVYDFFTPHYECVKPTAVYIPAYEKAAAEASTGEVATGDEETSTPTEAPPLFGTGSFVAVGACIAACCVAGLAAWHLSDSESKRIYSGKAMRYTEVAAASPASAADLELQAPLARNGAMAAAMAAPGASMQMAAPMQSSVQYSSMPYAQVGASVASAAPMMVAAPMGVPAAPMMTVGAAPAPMAVTAAPMVAMPGASVHTGVPMQAGSAMPGIFGGFMDQFDRMDMNHDGVLQRTEWDRGMQGQR